jgi:hypothetical protein
MSDAMTDRRSEPEKTETISMTMLDKITFTVGQAVHEQLIIQKSVEHMSIKDLKQVEVCVSSAVRSKLIGLVK